MMNIAQLLTTDRIGWATKVSSRKRCLEFLSKRLASGSPYLDDHDIFSALIEREKLGSTAIGHGVAIPHGRIKGCDRAIAAFVKLEQPINYEAVDRQPVDLLFALIVPESCTNEHLNILAVLAEMFSDATFGNQLRNAPSSEALNTLLLNWQSREQEHA